MKSFGNSKFSCLAVLPIVYNKKNIPLLLIWFLFVSKVLFKYLREVKNYNFCIIIVVYFKNLSHYKSNLLKQSSICFSFIFINQKNTLDTFLFPTFIYQSITS